MWHATRALGLVLALSIPWAATTTLSAQLAEVSSACITCAHSTHAAPLRRRRRYIHALLHHHHHHRRHRRQQQHLPRRLRDRQAALDAAVRDLTRAVQQLHGETEQLGREWAALQAEMKLTGRVDEEALRALFRRNEASRRRGGEVWRWTEELLEERDWLAEEMRGGGLWEV